MDRASSSPGFDELRMRRDIRSGERKHIPTRRRAASGACEQPVECRIAGRYQHHAFVPNTDLGWDISQPET